MPNVALTEQQARDAGHDVVGKIGFGAVGAGGGAARASSARRGRSLSTSACLRAFRAPDVGRSITASHVKQITEL
jgi:hypothetical protein